MDLKRAWGQFIIGLWSWKIQFSKYPTYTTINEILGPLIGGTISLLTGKFVGSVMYAGEEVPYAVFVMVGTAASFIYNALVRTFQITSYGSRKHMLFAEHPLLVPISRTFWLFVFATVQLVFWVLPVVLAYHVPIEYPVIAYVAANLSMLPTLAALGITLTAVGFRIRGRDLFAVSNVMLKILRLVVPASFGVSAYGPLRNAMMWIPTVAAMEGTRRYVFGIPGSGKLLAYSLISGGLLFIASYFLFKRMMYVARKKGWIMLQ